MSGEDIFRFGNLFALAGWLALAATLFVPALRRLVWPITALVMPGLLGAAYIATIVAGWGDGQGGGFGSLAALRQLFAADHALAAGWLHYLAFDLFVGSWVARNGLGLGLHPLLLLPCLFLTFIAGPIGLLLYLLLRLGLRRAEALNPR